MGSVWSEWASFSLELDFQERVKYTSLFVKVITRGIWAIGVKKSRNDNVTEYSSSK